MESSGAWSSGEGRWAVVEIMGHRRYAGIVSEEELFGRQYCRIDAVLPDGIRQVTKWFAPEAVFSVSPCSEEMARGVAARMDFPGPVTEWEISTMGPAVPEPVLAFGVRQRPDEDDNDNDDAW